MAAAEEESFRELAPESLKTRKAREKLLKAWEEEKGLFTREAIKETVNKIHKWIADNAKHRVPNKGKSIELFNQNKNAADVSKRVQNIADQLKEDMAQFGKKLP
jgi:hypothetical protein